MKKPIAKRFSGFVKVGAGAALGVAAIAAFIINSHTSGSNALIIDTSKNSAAEVVRIDSGSAASSETDLERNSVAPESSSEHYDKPININTASTAELQRLSGIGEARARAIVEYREKHGGFSDISEIKNVSGIGEKLFDDIRDRITVGNILTSTYNDAPTNSVSEDNSANAAQNVSYPINLNTASVDELQALSGIGEVKSRAIVEYREEHGEFSDISEIKNVSGIGEKLFDDIRDRITVGNVSTSTYNDAPTNSVSEDNSANAAQNVSFPININTAGTDELKALSGIGEVKARAIVEYREEHGEFSDISEIKNVNGIGEKIFDKIRADITV